MANLTQEKFKRHGKVDKLGYQWASKPVLKLGCARCKRSDKQPRQYVIMAPGKDPEWKAEPKGYCCMKCYLQHNYSEKNMGNVLSSFQLTEKEIVK